MDRDGYAEPDRRPLLRRPEVLVPILAILATAALIAGLALELSRG